MGDWVIVIRGTGQHHNGSEADAEVICKRFVDRLARSQRIHSATFTHGAELDIGVPKPDLVAKQIVQEFEQRTPEDEAWPATGAGDS